METTTTSFIDKAINGLRAAAAELEEFQVQFALGKAEASDKYEEVKKKFSDIIHDAKQKLNNTADLKNKFDELLLHLALGKAEAKEVFNEQKEKILKTIHEIENALKGSEIGMEFYLKLHSEIEKFKIKMEILRLRFELEKIDVKAEFESRKADFEKNVDTLKLKFMNKGFNAEKNWAHFCNEMSEAYIHLKKAVIF